jgi:hypothetical protein
MGSRINRECTSSVSSEFPLLARRCVDGWPTFTVFVKVGIHAAGNHGVEYKSRMELESSTQNQNNKLSASVVPTFTKNVKVGHPSGAKAMKKLLFVLFLWSVGAFAQSVKTAGAWMPVHVKWEHAPPSINPKLETGSATVLYFDGQDRFAVVVCVINRELGRYTTVSAGDGQVVSSGLWDGHLPGRVKYRLSSRTVERVGEKLPGPWQNEKLASTPKGYLLFKGELYRHVKDLESSIRELLPKEAEISKQQP